MRGRDFVVRFAVVILVLIALIGEAMRDSSLRRTIVGYLMLLVASLVALMFIGVAVWSVAHARDLDQWNAQDLTVRHWYQTLMQPDNPAVSCCGEADAYWADEMRVRNGKAYAVITDDRPDEPLKREHVEIGTEIEVPPHKLKHDQGNPTGHGVIFLSRGGYVWCYVMPGGV